LCVLLWFSIAKFHDYNTKLLSRHVAICYRFSDTVLNFFGIVSNAFAALH